MILRGSKEPKVHIVDTQTKQFRAPPLSVLRHPRRQYSSSLILSGPGNLGPHSIAQSPPKLQYRLRCILSPAVVCLLTTPMLSHMALRGMRCLLSPGSPSETNFSSEPLFCLLLWLHQIGHVVKEYRTSSPKCFYCDITLQYLN